MFKTQYWPVILKMAVPIVIAMLTQTAINILDTVMVSWLDPSFAVAGQSALGFSTPLLWLFGGFLSSISIGTLAIVARRQGAGQFRLAGAALTNAVVIAIISSLVVGTLAYAFVPQIFRMLIDNDAVVAFGVPYARYRLLGVLSMVTTAAIKSFFDGTSKTYVHMVASIVMNTANIVLNYLLIFGVGPFPDMNVAGAGLASLIATYIGLAIMIGWSFVPSLRKQYRTYHPSDLNAKTSWDIVRVSVPSGLANVFLMSGFLVFFKIIALLDEHASTDMVLSTSAYAGTTLPHWIAHQNQILDTTMGVHAIWHADLSVTLLGSLLPVYSSSSNILVSILSVTFMSAMAFGTGTASLVSQSLGRKDPKMAEVYIYESAKITVLVFVALGVFTYMFPEMIAGWLSGVDSVIAVTADVLRMFAFALFILACTMVFTQALFGAGNTKFVMYVEGGLFILLIPLAYFMGITLDLGVMGMWGAVIIYALALCVITFIKLRGGSWKKINI